LISKARPGCASLGAKDQAQTGSATKTAKPVDKPVRTASAEAAKMAKPAKASKADKENAAQQNKS